MSIDFYNPFHGILETKHYPHARAWRTGFLQKMADTFAVFSGNFFEVDTDPDRVHLGLLDWATLGTFLILAIINFEIYDQFNKSGPAGKVLYIAPLIISTFLDIVLNLLVRPLLGAVFMFALSPVVLAVYSFFKLIGSGTIKDEVKSNTVNVKEIGDNQQKTKEENPLEKKITLNAYLSQQGRKLGNVHVDCSGTYRDLTIKFNQNFPFDAKEIRSKSDHKPTYELSHESGHESGDESGHESDNSEKSGKQEEKPLVQKVRTEATLKLDLSKEADKKALEDLLKLNVGNLTAKLEKTSFDFSIFNKNQVLTAEPTFKIDTSFKLK